MTGVALPSVKGHGGSRIVEKIRCWLSLGATPCPHPEAGAARLGWRRHPSAAVLQPAGRLVSGQHALLRLPLSSGQPILPREASLLTSIPWLSGTLGQPQASGKPAAKALHTWRLPSLPASPLPPCPFPTVKWAYPQFCGRPCPVMAPCLSWSCSLCLGSFSLLSTASSKTSCQLHLH